ncbi:hypothetical protein [Methanothermobacter sp.]
MPDTITRYIEWPTGNPIQMVAFTKLSFDVLDLLS